jgi:sortase A
MRTSYLGVNLGCDRYNPLVTEATVPPTRRSRSSRRRGAKRRRTSIVGVIGEVLITLGVVALLYVAWQLWIGDLIYASERAAEAKSLSEQWQEDFEASQTEEPQPTPSASAATPAPADIPVMPEAADGEIFGTMWVPRFGADYGAKMAGGVTRARTLDPIGVGHYNGTPMPGAEGNVAVAGHRTTFGKPFNRIAELRVGDPIVIETPDGWYTYRFRTLEYVTPNAGDVLLPVPQQQGVAANGSYLTMTSCSPMYAMTERIIAYSVFDTFTPRADGPPASLTEGLA